MTQGAKQDRQVSDDPHLAASITTLADRKTHKLLFFYSSACSLCKSLHGTIQQDTGNPDWLRLVPVCTDQQLVWAPEMLHYAVDQVPCFVMVDQSGQAVAKSGPPRGLEHMSKSVSCMVELARSRGSKGLRAQSNSRLL